MNVLNISLDLILIYGLIQRPAKIFFLLSYFPSGIYLLKVGNWNIKKMYKICSRLTIKTPDWVEWCRFDVFDINFGQISHVAVLSLLLR